MTDHEYIGPRCCACCSRRNGTPEVPHEHHACHAGPQWSWLSHKEDPTDTRGREYCSCSRVQVPAG